MTITFTRRHAALALSILVLGERMERLSKMTNTTAADLRHIAAGELAPTAGVLRVLELESNGKGGYTWHVR